MNLIILEGEIRIKKRIIIVIKVVVILFKVLFDFFLWRVMVFGFVSVFIREFFVRFVLRYLL